jgi:hypothetical protein
LYQRLHKIFEKELDMLFEMFRFADQVKPFLIVFIGVPDPELIGLPDPGMLF